jgi:hypothetical protein
MKNEHAATTLGRLPVELVISIGHLVHEACRADRDGPSVGSMIALLLVSSTWKVS